MRGKRWSDIGISEGITRLGGMDSTSNEVDEKQEAGGKQHE
jgi:hypothetical protein